MRSKKLLILSSYGGYGHIAAANTLISILGKDYEIEVVYPIKELRIWGLPSGEGFYNFLISNSWNRITNAMVRYIAPVLFKHREDKTRRLIEKHIAKKQPDMVISLIPFVNFPAMEAARKYNLPFLLVTTDNNLHHWVYALKKRIHQNIKVAIGNNLPTSKNLLLQQQIPQHNIETLGLPLRPDFLQRKNKQQLKQEYEIPPNKSVALIMMGGVGARSIQKYCKIIAQSLLNVHLIVCTGKNQKLAAKLRSIQPTEGNSMDIIPFTEKVHELFALSDLIITKPGPGTINEAFAVQLPILIDQTNHPLFWEKVNIDLVLSHQVGECIPSFDDAANLVKKYLYDEQTREAVERAYQDVPSNQFNERIETLISEMCGEKVLPGEVVMTSRTILNP